MITAPPEGWTYSNIQCQTSNLAPGKLTQFTLPTLESRIKGLHRRDGIATAQMIPKALQISRLDRI